MRLSAAVVLLLPAMTGCAFMKSLVGRNSVDLSEAEVKSMSVDLRKEVKTICPRAPVQMAVFAEVLPKGEKQAKSFETYVGGDEANRNDKLEFTDFAFHSELGAFDAHGRFAPQRDLRLSLDKEFEIKTVFKRRPDKFSFATKYKPEYSCIKAGGGAGKSGVAGRGGASGSSGQMASNGGRGGSGGPGSNGASGSDGETGPTVKAFATIVKTPFYERLVAVRVTGDVDDLLLFPADQPFTLTAAGGSGGAGGHGGSGGSGGGGGSGFVGGDGGSGGSGGMGGSGGRGGPGGNVELVLDPAFPELAGVIRVDVSGGPGGAAGAGGSPGSGGSAGPGQGQGSRMGNRGTNGTSGTPGTQGMRGPDGHATINKAPVAERFADISAIEVLSSPKAKAVVEAVGKDVGGKKAATKKGKIDDGSVKKPSSSKSVR